MYQRVVEALEEFFGDDERRIQHAKQVYTLSLRINEVEGGERDVVALAALLHDVGIKPAEKLHGSSRAAYQEELGPPIAEEILVRLGFDEATISSVKEIIASHHTPGRVTTREFACIWDADMIVNLKDAENRASGKAMEEIIDRRFMTDGGKKIAREILME